MLLGMRGCDVFCQSLCPSAVLEAGSTSSDLRQFVIKDYPSLLHADTGARVSNFTVVKRVPPSRSGRLGLVPARRAFCARATSWQTAALHVECLAAAGAFAHVFSPWAWIGFQTRDEIVVDWERLSLLTVEDVLNVFAIGVFSLLTIHSPSVRGFLGMRSG